MIKNGGSSYARAPTPPSETDGHYAHRQVRRCVIAADPHDLHSVTRGFAALHARQPAPERAAEIFGGSHELRAQVRQEG